MTFDMAPPFPALHGASALALQSANSIPHPPKFNEKLCDSRILELLLTFQLQLQGSPHQLSHRRVLVEDQSGRFPTEV